MTTTNDDSSSPRPDPAAVEAAKRNILVWLQLNDEERSRRRIADEIGVLFDALAARDEAGEALRTLEGLVLGIGGGSVRIEFDANDEFNICVHEGYPGDWQFGKTLPEAIAALARQLPQAEPQPTGSSKEEGQG